MQTDTPTKFSSTTIALHWIVGLMMIGLLAIGVYMAETESYALYPWHKSFGILIFIFVIARVTWRIKNGWPSPASQYTRIEHLLSKIIHYALLIGTILMPISGFVMSTAGGHGAAVFGLELVAMNPDPANPGEMLPFSATWASIGHTAHHWLGYLLIAALCLHVVGALKHHLVDKDGTLRRMLGAEI